MHKTVRFQRHRFAVLAVAAVVVVTGVARHASAQSPAEHSAAVPAQNAGAAPDAQKTMTIHVQLSDNQGHPVEALQEGDFTLLDNNQPQKLLGFRAVDASVLKSDPVQVVIVVDMINADAITVAREREEVGAYLKANGGELPNPTSIALIEDSGVKVLPVSTQHGDLLLASFNQTHSELRGIGRGGGLYGATENVQKSLLELGQLIQYEGKKPGRKLVLVVGPGWPLLSLAGDRADSKQRAWVFSNIVQFTNLLRDSNVALYCIDPFEVGGTDLFEYKGFLKGISAVKDATYPDLGLQVLATHTGGQVFISGRDILGSLKIAVRDASGGYDLTFAPAPGDRVNEYHALDVRVDKPNIKVRTTSGYYARVQWVRDGKGQ
ncbi:MAG TPA: VWA domain-containing protein [Terracidiphilus sp.]|nr:VWA domain-containing protein [Terracidiphilus sp.]